MENKVELVWKCKGKQKPNLSAYTHIEPQYVFPNQLKDNDLFPQPIIPVNEEHTDFTGRLIQGDNLKALELLIREGYQEQLDLIYIDPPYLSRKKYSSKIRMEDRDNLQDLERLVFVDQGEANLECYLNELYTRLELMRSLLSSRGSIFVHLDWHVSHYVKIILDEIFGSRNFINEIVWCYGGGSGSKRHFHRKHDLIFWYSKSDKYIFNPQYRPYSKGTLERGLTKVKGNRYSLNKEGAIMEDWWTDINKILSPTAYENLKFPTQKPESLLKRLISAASHPQSLVADFYAGSGTTAAACEKLNRKWISCDNSTLATSTAIQRMVRINSKPFIIDRLTKGENNHNHVEVEVGFTSQSYDKDYIRVDIEIRSFTVGDNSGLGTSFQTQIQFWELDLDYRGDVFRSQAQVMRDKIKWDNSLPVAASFLIPRQGTNAVAIRVHDVFGGCCTRVLSLP